MKKRFFYSICAAFFVVTSVIAPVSARVVCCSYSTQTRCGIANIHRRIGNTCEVTTVRMVICNRCQDIISETIVYKVVKLGACHHY